MPDFKQYLVVTERDGKIIQSRPYTPEGFQTESTFAIVMAQAGVGPIGLHRVRLDGTVELIVTMTGSN